jgi:hypothetical protein
VARRYRRAVFASVALFALAACTSFDVGPPLVTSDAGPDPSDAQSTTDSGADSTVDAETADGDAASDTDAGPSDRLLCAQGTSYLGSFATWYGKVNVHTSPDGSWVRDDDCASGALKNDVAYCQEIWPAATDIAEAAAVSPIPKPFWDEGCDVVVLDPGQKQYACCGRHP